MASLHPERRPRREDVQVRGGHVKLPGLLGAHELAFGHPLPGRRLLIAPDPPAEIVDGPEELHFGLHIAVGPWGAAGQEKACRTRGARPLIIRGGPGLEQEVNLRQERRKGHLLLAAGACDGGAGHRSRGLCC